jgi:hypothetical protein
LWLDGLSNFGSGSGFRRPFAFWLWLHKNCSSKERYGGVYLPSSSMLQDTLPTRISAVPEQRLQTNFYGSLFIMLIVLKIYF